MLKEVKQIGDFAIKHQGLKNLDILVEEPLTERVIEEGNAKVICMDFNLKNNELDYDGVHVEDYDRLKSDRYLYRDHPSHRFRITPTDKISTLEKTSWRIAYWFRKFEEYLSNKLVNNLKEELVEKENIKKNIISDIEREFESLEADSKKNCLLTFTFQTNEKQKYLGDFQIFNRILKEEGMSEFWAPGVPLESGTCYICEEEKRVSRPREPFSFYTVNPRGFAQNLQVKESWKQLPICPECVLSLEAGRNFMDKHLSKSFYGYRFYVVPVFVFEEVKDRIMKEIIDLKEREYKDSLLSEEDDISYYIKEKGDIVNLIFVFYSVKQGGKNFDILKYIEDVPPSWIKQIVEAFEKINTRALFREEPLRENFGSEWSGCLIDGSYKGKKQAPISLGGILRTFFPDSDKSGKYDKEFLDVIGAVLSKQKIQKDVLIEAFVREIRNKHINEDKWNEKLLSLKSLYLLSFFNKLKLLRGERDRIGKKIEMKGKKGDKRRQEVENFFEDFSGALNSKAKKAVFLEGVLTRFLLDIQSGKRGSTPFRSKLRSLRLDKSKVKSLFPEITEKLRQYEAPYYTWLEELISEHFIAADNEGWDISRDEISYYFALGLNLGRAFKNKEENEGGEKSE